jgi:hypothetical protein
MMNNIDVPVASQILLTGLVSAVFTGILVFAFQKVFERWIQRAIQTEARQIRFIERQLEEFYSPMMGCLRKIQAKSLLRLEIDKVSDIAWKEICKRHPKPFLDHEKYFDPFMKAIRYNNKELREEIIPLYDEMLSIFTEKYWLANPSTRKWFSELSAFVDLWHRWLDESIPADVVREIGHNEDQLKPFYEDLESYIDVLQKRLSGV